MKWAASRQSRTKAKCHPTNNQTLCVCARMGYRRMEKKVKVSPIPASGRRAFHVYSFDLWEDDPFAMGQHLQLLHNAFRRNETRSEVTFSRLDVASFIAYLLHTKI